MFAGAVEAMDRLMAHPCAVFFAQAIDPDQFSRRLSADSRTPRSDPDQRAPPQGRPPVTRPMGAGHETTPRQFGQVFRRQERPEGARELSHANFWERVRALHGAVDRAVGAALFIAHESFIPETVTFP